MLAGRWVTLFKAIDMIYLKTTVKSSKTTSKEMFESSISCTLISTLMDHGHIASGLKIEGFFHPFLDFNWF